ncbi:MAG: hypothetical protein JF606_23350 [Burkholderiales bacterium]|nr:hypothetical protein [Burkholderiales bacterium]
MALWTIRGVATELLREHASRLGPRYVAMLPLLAEPGPGGSADGTETAEQLQLAVHIGTRMRQLLAAGKSRQDILANMFDYRPAFKRLMDTLPHEDFNRLCQRFDPIFLSYPIPKASSPGFGLGPQANIRSTM